MRLSLPAAIVGLALCVSLLCCSSLSEDKPFKGKFPYFKYALGTMHDDRDFWTAKKEDNFLWTITGGVTMPELNIGYVGRGYDAFYGNPKETSLGGDSGYRRPVFFLDHSEEKFGIDWRNIHPKKVDVTTRMSCDASMTTKSITSVNDLLIDIGDSRGFSKGGGPDVQANAAGGLFSASFANRDASASSESFTHMKHELKESENAFLSLQATCSIYEASINLFSPPEFDPIFKSALSQLPKEYNDDAVAIYERFIREYGTHVTRTVLMGSRFGKYYTMSKQNIDNAFADTKHSSYARETSHGAGASAFGFGGSTSTKTTFNTETNSSTSGASALSAMSSDEKIYSVGAPYNPSPVEWAKAASSDPFPVHITLVSLPELIANHYDKTIAKNVKHALDKYRPPGVERIEGTEFEKCYLEKTEHTIMEAHVKQTSLIARCKPGYSAFGGAFVHLWNIDGDVEVDELATSAEQIMGDLKKFHELDSQERAAKFFLHQGADLLDQYTQARSMDDIKEIFGNSIDPTLTKKFLDGTLRSLGLEKNKVLGGLVNGLQVFGQTKLGGMAKDFLKQNPYANSIMEVSGNLLGALNSQSSRDRTVAITLSVDAIGNPDSVESEQRHKLAENHVRTLIHVLDAVDQHKGNEVQHEEEAKPQFFGNIVNAIQTVTSALNQFMDKHGDAPWVTAALKKWNKFSANFDDIWKQYSHQIRDHETKIKSTGMYQDIVTKVTQDHIAGTTLLAQRNALNFLFPYEDNAFVCGGGSLGMEPTKRSSLGYCTAYCCRNSDWKLSVTNSRRAKVELVEKTAEIETVCPSGYSVVSGGVLLGDYQEGRFVQVVSSHAKGDDTWRCKIRWSEEDYIPYSPRFKCHAKCALARMSTVECTNKMVPLVNGHGTVHCASSEMALSGGWDIQSYGITYFKKTEFQDVSGVDGARSFRCEFGTTHGKIIGSCLARCCSAYGSDLEKFVVNEVQGSESCKPYWETLKVPAPPSVRMLGMQTEPRYKPVGNVLNVNDILDTRQVLTSKNMEFFLTFHPFLPHITVYEDYSCGKPHRIGEMSMHVNSFHCIFKNIRNGGGYLQLKEDGFVCSFEGNDVCAIWEVAAKTVKYVTLKDNGDLTFYDVDDNVVFNQAFSENRLFFKKIGIDSPVLNAGEVISLGRGLLSANRKYSFLFLEGGKLAVGFQERDGERATPYKVIWTNAVLGGGNKITDEHSLTQFNLEFKKEGWTLILQDDNNLVIYDDSNNAIWASGTHGMGHGLARLEITDKGNVELRDAVGVLLWTLRGGVIQSCVTLRERLKIRSHRLGMTSVLRPGIGGLVSKNRQFLVFIETRGHQSNLELWREGGEDCKPARLRVLKENVQKLELTHNAVVVNDKEEIAKFDSAPLFDMVLDDSAHLTVYAGKNHRREYYVQLFEAGRHQLQPRPVGYVEPDKIQYSHQDINEMKAATRTIKNWKGSFGISQEMWSRCPEKSFLRGWKQVGNWQPSLTGVEEAICGTFAQDVECVRGDWWSSFDKKGLSSCPEGYVVSGLFTTGSKLYNIEEADCCRLKQRTAQANDCYIDDKGQALDGEGTFTCDREKYYIAGFDRNECNELFCLEKWKCCRME